MEDSDVIKSLLDLISQQNNQIIELSRALAETKAPQFTPPLPMSTGPLFYTESEEDAMAAYAAGEIDKKELESVLKELNFYNTELVTPSAL